ncbi:conserved hypothetical protein, partial [Ricinus communis]
ELAGLVLFQDQFDAALAAVLAQREPVAERQRLRARQQVARQRDVRGEPGVLGGDQPERFGGRQLPPEQQQMLLFDQAERLLQHGRRGDALGEQLAQLGADAGHFGVKTLAAAGLFGRRLQRRNQRQGQFGAALPGTAGIAVLQQAPLQLAEPVALQPGDDRRR